MRNKERQHFAISRHFFAIGKIMGRNIFLIGTMNNENKEQWGYQK